MLGEESQDPEPDGGAQLNTALQEQHSLLFQEDELRCGLPHGLPQVSLRLSGAPGHLLHLTHLTDL